MSPVADSVRSLLQQALDPVDFASIDIPALILDNDGDPSVNIAKYGAKWNWLNATPFPVPLAAAYGAGGQATAMVSRPGVQGGDFEILGFQFKSDDRFGVLPNLPSLNLDLCNTPMVNTLIMGKGVGGAPMCVSAYEPASGAVVFKNLTNLAQSGANNVECLTYGRRFLGLESSETVEARRAAFLTTRLNAFWVGPDAGQNNGEALEFTLGPGAHLQLKCTLPTIGDFLAITPVDDSTATTTPNTRPSFTVQITDGLTGYQLMPTPISVQDYVAACNFPGTDRLLVPASFDGPFSGIFTHLFARGGQIVLDFYSQENVRTIKVRFGFRGVLIRYKPAQGRSTNTSAEVRASILSRAQPMPFLNVAQGGRS